MHYAHMDSPVGTLLVAGDEKGLRAVRFANDRGAAAPEPGWRQDAASLAAPLDQLEAYFASELQAFELDLAPRGSEFQRSVWEELQRIPYGTTISYGELAARVGRRGAARAVGTANGANPLPIIVPCHRVIGADGSLTGYGGGLEIKERLLAHEGARLCFA